MSNYYCLISGLPDLSPEDPKVPITLLELKEYLTESLSKKDMTLINLFYRKYDNENLLSFLKNGEAILNPLGDLSANQLHDIVTLNRESDTPKYSGMPSYFIPFLQDYIDDKSEKSSISEEDYLSSLYYNYACGNGNKVIREFFEFMLNIKNIIIGIQCRKFGFDVSKSVIGNNNVANAIRTSTSKDFGLAGELSYLEEMIRLAEEPNILVRELKLDKLVWDYLEEQTFFHYFTVERVFAYLIRTDIIERWETVKKKNGEEIFRSVVGELQGAYTFSDEFKV